MSDSPESLEGSPLDDRGHRQVRHLKSRRVHEISGTFVLIILAVLIGIVLWTGRSQRWFKSNVTLRIILPEAGAAGIRQGSEVYFLGTLVGSVHNVIVDKTGRMEARTSIHHDFFLFVRADSTALVKRKFGVAGDSFFEITRGHGRPLPENNASIVCNEQVQSALESAIEGVSREAVLMLRKTSSGLDTWTALGSNLITSRERLDELIGRADKLAAGLEEGKGTAGKILTDPSIADDLKELVAKGAASIDELHVTLKNFEAASGNLREASTNLPAITDALGSEAKDLPGLVAQTQTSMRELERLIEAMQRNWLVRKHINPTNPSPVRPALANGSTQKKPGKRSGPEVVNRVQ